MSAEPSANSNLASSSQPPPPPPPPPLQPPQQQAPQIQIKAEDPDLDIDMTNMPLSNGLQTAPGSSQGPDGVGAAGPAAPPAPPIPTRRDRTLREFLDMMEEYAPIIPDAVTDYYLALSGMQTSDVRLKRLLALATQKFIADIAADAYQYSRIRQNSSNSNSAPGLGAAGAAAVVGGIGATGGGGGGALRPMARPGFGGAGGSGASGGRTVLTMEDLGSAVGEYGVNTRRPEFYR